MGRPVGAKGDGLAGGDVSEVMDCGLSDMLSVAGAQSWESEPSSSSVWR